MKIVKYQDREIMMIDLAGIIASELESALHHQDRATFVVSGGSTPGPIYDDLCSVNMEWSRVDVLLSDERWVPEDHERSNTRMVRERLLTDNAAKARYLPLYAKADQASDVLVELESVILPALPISVALLGMGDDLHTASLFPDDPNLGAALDSHAPVLVVATPPSQPEQRISISARVLNEAISKHIVITGQAKLDALEAAKNLSIAQAPIKAVLDGATIHWAK